MSEALSVLASEPAAVEESAAGVLAGEPAAVEPIAATAAVSVAVSTAAKGGRPVLAEGPVAAPVAEGSLKKNRMRHNYI